MSPARVSRSLLIGAVVVGLLAVTPIAVASLDPGGTFSDDNGSVHEGAIEAIAAEGITRGCNPPVNDLFCPSATVTREQMATFLVRALDLPVGSATFSDVGSSVHAANISALASAGITKGCNPPDNTLFCPTSPVTREQMGTFLTRALDLTSMTPPDPLPEDIPGDSVVIGDESWLYFAETLEQACLTADVFDRLVEELEKAGTIVTTSGRDFVYAVPPNKVTVYPDFYAGYVGSCAEQNSVFLNIALLASLDPNRVLLWEAFDGATDQLYFKHDTHWNVDGALYGSELIAEKAALDVWDQLDLVASPATRQGDLASIIGATWEIDYAEQTPTLTGVTPIVTVEATTIAGRPLVSYSSPGNPELSDVRTAIIHDSFGMFFRNKLGPLFEDVTFLPTFSHPIPDAAASAVTDSEQIVIEVVERNVLRDFLGTGTAGMLAALLADDYAQTPVAFIRNGESVDLTVPAGTAGDLRYVIVELDTTSLPGPIFIRDPAAFTATSDAWPAEITSDASRYGFEVGTNGGTVQLPLPSSVTVTAAYLVVIE